MIQYRGCVTFFAKDEEDFKEKLRDNFYPIEELLEIEEVQS